jgi:hypothetical protein
LRGGATAHKAGFQGDGFAVLTHLSSLTGWGCILAQWSERHVSCLARPHPDLLPQGEGTVRGISGFANEGPANPIAGVKPGIRNYNFAIQLCGLDPLIFNYKRGICLARRQTRRARRTRSPCAIPDLHPAALVCCAHLYSAGKNGSGTLPELAGGTPALRS